MTTHLTFTGFYAGQPICGATRVVENDHVHSAYAPLDSKQFRRMCCVECLKVYAESYDDEELAKLDDNHWVKETLKGNT